MSTPPIRPHSASRTAQQSMLSRTADHLFWMTRYMERADNTARMLDINLQTSLLPQEPEARQRSWRAVLAISELQDAFDAKHPNGTPSDVLHFMVRDASNPSSIYSCLHAARENARAVRGSLTTEVWETYNLTWIELNNHLNSRLPERNPTEFFEWVRLRSQLTRGVSIDTMIEDEALYFLRLGLYLERADNTARLLDVKFHERDGEAPKGKEDGEHDSISDFYHWSAVLSSVSGLEIYRKVYSDIITPERVAELLILRDDIPRSLLTSMRVVAQVLDRVANQRSGETERRAGMLYAELQYGRVQDILRGGMHAYLDRFLGRINDLGNRIAQDFLVPLSK